MWFLVISELLENWNFYSEFVTFAKNWEFCYFRNLKKWDFFDDFETLWRKYSLHTRTHTVHIKSALLKVGRLYSTCNSHLEVNGMENLCWKMIFWSRVESFAIMAFSSLFSADLTTFIHLKGSQKIQKMVDSQFISLASNGLHWPRSLFTTLSSRCNYSLNVQ